jgi:hypothetical protein
MPRSPTGPQAHLVAVSCPELVPLADASFGATTRKLLEVVQHYHECRRAALSAP